MKRFKFTPIDQRQVNFYSRDYFENSLINLIQKMKIQFDSFAMQQKLKNK